MRIKIACITLLIGFLVHCTKNPIEDNKINPENNQTISGSVRLSDKSSPDDVFIWLEGTKISVRTDSKGAYKLQLPSPELQSGGGMDGVFNLYFYLANYKLASTKVSIARGKFVFGRYGINQNGILDSKTLTKLVDISTEVQPDQYTIGNGGYIDIYISLTNTMTTTYITTFYDYANDLVNGIIFKNRAKASSEAEFRILTIYAKTLAVAGDSVLQMSFFSGDLKLEAGEYDVIPLIYIEQEGMPEGLLQAIGEKSGLYDVHPDYLKIPFKQQYGYLKIIGG